MLRQTKYDARESFEFAYNFKMVMTNEVSNMSKRGGGKK